MNRKLRNTILAFSVSGVMLLVGLLVAQPLPAPVESPFADGLPQPADVLAAQDNDSDATTAREALKPRRSGAREVISIPYFSFARGARGSRS